MSDIIEADEITGGVRSPRLEGMWSLQRFLHNGSVRSLEDIFCLKGPRPEGTGAGMSLAGHSMTCTDHTEAEKTALIEFIRSL